MPAASAKSGTVRSTASRAVWVRSSVVPIRVAASLSSTWPADRGTRCAIISAPAPGSAIGSQRRATVPPPAKASDRVAVQTRPARASPRACRSSWPWPRPGSSASHASCPTIARAGQPNRRAAPTVQVATRPCASRVKVASPARSGLRGPGGADSPTPATCGSTGMCTNLDDEFAGPPAFSRSLCRAAIGPPRHGPGSPRKYRGYRAKKKGIALTAATRGRTRTSSAVLPDRVECAA
jgi:hypothetical protein